MEWSGGCLCGAVRYKSSEAPHFASYCHCGMCRKASGAPYMAFVEFPNKALEWLETPPAIYSSSQGVIRRFCRTCGSPLTFEADGVLFISLGSLDAPEQVTISAHAYTLTHLPYVMPDDGLPHFPGPVGGKGGRPID